MLILDGYTERKVFDDVLVEYRPMLRPERDAVFQRAEMSPQGERDAIYEVAVRRKMFWCGAPMDVGRDIIFSVMGLGRDEFEVSDSDNLYRGAIQHFRYPGLLDCETCQKWSVNPLTGQFQMRGGQRVPRQSLDDLLCRTREGCPAGSPEQRMGLSPKNRQALAFDLDCRAVGEWPDDPIVRRNARIIGLAIRKARVNA